jgi:hypothetical protein
MQPCMCVSVSVGVICVCPTARPSYERQFLYCTPIFIEINVLILNLFVKEVLFHLCGLVVRVPGNRSRGPGFDSRRPQIF